jgi:hypothetical protein
MRISLIRLAVIAALAARDPLMRPVTVSVQLGSGSQGSISGTIELEAAQPQRGEPASRRVRIALPGEATLELPEGSQWRVTVQAPGYWSRPGYLAVGGLQAPALQLFPAGTIEGRLKLPPGRSPARIFVLFRSAPGAAERFAPTTEVCALDGARFRCAVPAGTLDFRLRIPGFITHSRWGARVPRGGKLDMGSLELKPGASIVGWIVAPDRTFRWADCKVEISPLESGPGASLADVSRQSVLRQKATVNSRGFFEFDSLAPGSYALVASYPALAPTTIAPLIVEAGLETEVKAIELQAPARLEVRLTPQREPGGGRWVISLFQRGPVPGRTPKVAKATTDAEGSWTSDGLPPGSYLIQIEGDHGSIWASQDVALVPGMAPYDIQLPFVRVEGDVSLGREPLRALLWFGGSHGSKRVATRSDEKGRFALTLPEQKEPWRVEVENAPLHIRGLIPALEIAKSSGRQIARVKIELPDTTVRGDVVDEQGEAAQDAVVRAVGQAPGADSVRDTSTKAEGRFELRGLAPGRWRFEASRNDGDVGMLSDAVEAEVEKDQPLENVRLVLRRRIKLSGQVVSPVGQPIPGVKVVAFTVDEAGRSGGFVPEALTDVNGVFELRLPAGSERASLSVFAVGFAARAVTVDIQGAQGLVIPVSPLGGTIVLDFGATAGDELEVAMVGVWLFRDTVLGSGTYLQAWAAVNGVVPPRPNQRSVPMLEPGSYTVCTGTAAALAVLHTARAPVGAGGSCAHGEVVPGGELMLRVPTAKDHG